MSEFFVESSHQPTSLSELEICQGTNLVQLQEFPLSNESDSFVSSRSQPKFRQRPSKKTKKQSTSDCLNSDQAQGWQQEAVGFGPFWSEYDMWI